MLPFMRDQTKVGNWLLRYAGGPYAADGRQFDWDFKEVGDRSLEGMHTRKGRNTGSRRTKYPNRMNVATVELKKHFDQFETEFKDLLLKI